MAVSPFWPSRVYGFCKVGEVGFIRGQVMVMIEAIGWASAALSRSFFLAFWDWWSGTGIWDLHRYSLLEHLVARWKTDIYASAMSQF